MWQRGHIVDHRQAKARILDLPLVGQIEVVTVE
jgi:hypothetical protein